MSLLSRALLFAVSCGLAACGASSDPNQTAVLPETPGATPKAVCGPGSNPETGMQGHVSRAEHETGETHLLQHSILKARCDFDRKRTFDS